MIDQIIEQAKQTFNGILNQFRSQFMQDIVKYRDQLKEQYTDALAKTQEISKNFEAIAKDQIAERVKLFDTKFDELVTKNHADFEKIREDLTQVSNKFSKQIENELQAMRDQTGKTIIRIENELTDLTLRELDDRFVKLVEKNEERIGKLLWKALYKSVFKSKKK